jgi:membrane-bound lytic murein transglycosylase A
MTSGRWRRRFTTGRIGSAALILLCIASVAQAKGRNPMKIPGAQYEPVTWAAIEGWADDDHEAAFAAFLNSCKAILRGSREGQFIAALYKVCERATNAKPHKLGEARAFFEQNFRPVRISPLGTPDGFLTGYYEPIAEGTRERTGSYEHPLYRKPASLIGGGQMQIASAASGKKKARKRRLVPFYERASIDDGILAGRNLEICWLRDPIDSFFAHIQGSVRVLLDDGKLLRLNYQAANGHPYYAVGRWLVDRKIIPKDEMSMDRIRQWMERNPKEGEELRRMNKSYVFFRETDLADDQEPIGAQGISLTPGRSIAVDRKLHTYGTPFFISAMLPIETEKPETPFRRLMIAQDTGGAIVGPARADIYFGAGDEAGSVSGRLRHNGRFVMLMPKEVDPSADIDEVPLPRPRPPIPVAEDKPAATPAKTVAAPSEPAKPESAKSEVKPDTKPDAKPAVAATKKPAKTAEDKRPAAKPKKEAKSKSETKPKSEIKIGPTHDPQS